MRILVTGGSGYIGSHTVQALLDAGHRPVVLDLRELPEGLRDHGVDVVIGDIRDPAAVGTALRHGPIEAVIHLAAEKSVAASMADPDRFFDVNVGGTETVLRGAVEAGVRAVVFSSSCAVYGTPDRLPIDEDSPLRPENPYGESKRRAEALLEEFDRRRGVRSMSLRYFNAAGASADGRLGEDWRGAPNLLPIAVEAALGRRGPVEVYGGDHPTPDGSAIRDYVHVVDLAEAHVAAIEALQRRGSSETLNLGTGRGTSVLEMLDVVGDAAGRGVPFRVVARRPGDPSAVWADPGRARAVLGWSARLDLKAIAASAVAWHRRGVGEPVPVARV